jgi:uncharacterized membrane protein
MNSEIRQRINSIDMMRGLVMLIMLVDHVRERFFLHMQVSDPMDIDATSPGLFFSRFAAHFCAPAFVFLTGISAWLYASNGRNLTGFLMKRGLFLILLEVTLVTFSWMGAYETIWLQVIWAIGLCMVALALLHRLPFGLLLIAGLSIVFGHNLLTDLNFTPSDSLYPVWTVLHDRGYLLQSDGLNIKISYPVLPWIGVILLGYCSGPLFGQGISTKERKTALLRLGVFCLVLFALLRGFNLYGETQDWTAQASILLTAMDVFNLTKYPPSLAFLLITLGTMFLLLRAAEAPLISHRKGLIKVLTGFGAAPMFFYLLHLYALLLINSLLLLFIEPNYGELIGVNHIGWIWLIATALALALYWPTQAFAALKKRHKHPLLSYF